MGCLSEDGIVLSCTGPMRPAHLGCTMLVKQVAAVESPRRDAEENSGDRQKNAKSGHQFWQSGIQPEHLIEGFHRPENDGEAAQLLDRVWHQTDRKPRAPHGAHQQDHKRRKAAGCFRWRGDTRNQHPRCGAAGRHHQRNERQIADMIFDLDAVQDAAANEQNG